MEPCPVCAIPLGHRETCPSPACPCYGLAARSVEAEVAAERWRARPSVAAARTLTGDVALEVLERMAWLGMMEARGRVFEIEIEHRSL